MDKIATIYLHTFGVMIYLLVLSRIYFVNSKAIYTLLDNSVNAKNISLHAIYGTGLPILTTFIVGIWFWTVAGITKSPETFGLHNLIGYLTALIIGLAFQSNFTVHHRDKKMVFADYAHLKRFTFNYTGITVTSITIVALMLYSSITFLRSTF